MDRLMARRNVPTLQYQKDTVVAVFPTSAAALRAITALEAAGVTREDAHIISGEPSAAAQGHGLRRRFTDGYDALHQYAAYLEAGYSLVAAHVADRGAAHHVAALLREADGGGIAYLGPWTIEALPGVPIAAPPSQATHLSGRIAAGASTTIGTYLLPDVLGAFHARYPSVALSLAIGDTAAIEARLREGALDIAVVEGPVTPDLAPDSVLVDHLVGIVPAMHPLAGRESVSMAELASAPFLLREPGSGTREAVLRSLARFGVTPNVAMEIGGTEAIVRAVRAGLGVSIVSELAVMSEDADRLHVLSLNEGPIERDLTVVCRRGDQTPPVEQRFLEALRAHLAPAPSAPA